MNLKDLVLIVVRLFGAYHAYLFVTRLLRVVLIATTNSIPDGVPFEEIAIANGVQTLVSLAIAVSIFKWSDKIVSWFIKPSDNVVLLSNRKNGVFLILVLSGLQCILLAFPDFVADFVIYIDYTQMNKYGVEIINTVETRGFGVSSRKNPIFSLAYSGAQVVAGFALILFARKLTAYILTGFKSA